MARPAINKYMINRDDCEIEVSYRAMKVYVDTYMCYETWDIRETQKSILGKPGYIGSYELYKGENTLTADILTSIKYMYNILLKKEYRYSNGISGQEIIKNYEEGIFDKEIESRFMDKYKGCVPYLKAFLNVYYWCGNMMPVCSNPTGGMHGCDNWYRKINYIMNCFEEKDMDAPLKIKWEKEWKKWISDVKEDGTGFRDFISNNYLIDCLDFEKGIKNMSSTNKLIENALEDDVKEWFINHTKFIIQRSYRILNRYDKEWDVNTFKPVRNIISNILKKAGFELEECKVYSETWF